jgi:hypothetical protein
LGPLISHFGSEVDMDQSRMWEALVARRDATENPRHRLMLDVAIEHARAEAERPPAPPRA